MSVEGLAALVTAIAALVAALGSMGLHVQLRKQVKASAPLPVIPKG